MRVIKLVLVFSVLVLLMNACNTNNIGQDAQDVPCNKKISVPILIKPNGYEGNLCLTGGNDNNFFYINGCDTIVYLNEGQNWINTGATVGGNARPTAYICFDIKDGKITKLYNTAAAKIGANQRTLILQTVPFTIATGDYDLKYFLSAYHFNFGNHSYQHNNRFKLIKGIRYNINNSTFDFRNDSERSYFYFDIDSIGKIEINDVCNPKYSFARTSHDTMFLNTTRHKIVRKSLPANADVFLGELGIPITKDTTISLMSGLLTHYLLRTNVKDSAIYFMPKE